MHGTRSALMLTFCMRMHGTSIRAHAYVRFDIPFYANARVVIRAHAYARFHILYANPHFASQKHRGFPSTLPPAAAPHSPAPSLLHPHFAAIKRRPETVCPNACEGNREFIACVGSRVFRIPCGDSLELAFPNDPALGPVSLLPHGLSPQSI